jgi:tRNA (mo5U34)-methyltransferase
MRAHRRRGGPRRQALRSSRALLHDEKPAELDQLSARENCAGRRELYRMLQNCEVASTRPPTETPDGPGSFDSATGIVVTAAEREVADLLPIEAAPSGARRVLRKVPFWFHTFALNREQGIYTPGAARDHRYRVRALPSDFSGMRVLDVGSFDGFYAFLAEARGAERVVAVDNEQYRAWVEARWGVRLRGGEGFRAIRELLGSGVEYRPLDAFELDVLEELFDLVYCCGILHRVENPLGLLRVLRRRLAEGGSVLLETYGVEPGLRDEASILVAAKGETYKHDEFVYWGFTAASVRRLGQLAGFAEWEVLDQPIVDGHPRLLGTLRA